MATTYFTMISSLFKFSDGNNWRFIEKTYPVAFLTFITLNDVGFPDSEFNNTPKNQLIDIYDNVYLSKDTHILEIQSFFKKYNIILKTVKFDDIIFAFKKLENKLKLN